MTSTYSSRPCEAIKARLAAIVIASLAVSYSLLSVYYFYEDFFKYLGHGAAVYSDRTGWLVSVDGRYLFTILSPWRLFGAALAVAMLGVSAVALWRGRPKARALSLITLWGVLLPQVLWYTEFVTDWHHGRGMTDIVALAFLAVLAPSLLLWRRGQALADWQTRWPDRLLGLTVACAWIGFAASEFVDHSYIMASWTAYIGALVAMPLAALAVKSLYHLRAWGLWAGVAAAVALSMVPLAASFTTYTGTGGFIDDVRMTTAGSDTRIAASMLLPLAAIWLLAAPYLHAFVRKLRAAQ